VVGLGGAEVHWHLVAMRDWSWVRAALALVVEGDGRVLRRLADGQLGSGSGSVSSRHE